MNVSKIYSTTIYFELFLTVCQNIFEYIALTSLLKFKIKNIIWYLPKSHKKHFKFKSIIYDMNIYYYDKDTCIIKFLIFLCK